MTIMTDFTAVAYCGRYPQDVLQHIHVAKPRDNIHNAGSKHTNYTIHIGFTTSVKILRSHLL
jgi:hypothetical protein